jgi:hypothetical protein
MDPLSEKEAFEAVENGVHALTILRGDAQDVVYNPYIELELSIAAAFEYLEKSDVTDAEIKDSYVLYSYEGLFLNLVFSNRNRTNDENKGDFFKGMLKLHPELDKWQINKAKAYDNMSLSHFIKMNRHFFEDKDIAMKLVHELQGIRIKVDKEFEHSDNKRGDYKEVIAQRITESNIPAEFTLLLPVFVGQKPQKVRVEIEVNPKSFECSLISPDLKEIIDLETRALIDTQLEKIRGLYPKLRIYQK